VTETRNQNNYNSAIARSKIYYFILHSFIRLPDAGLVEELKSPEFLEFINIFYDAGNIRLKQANAAIRSYCAGIESRDPEDVLNELAVDRTRLLRGTFSKTLRPPYESLYVPAINTGDIISFVKNDYRKAGILPDENIGEMLDYLGVELDFMYQLCLCEEEKRHTGEDVIPTIILEEEFLNNHLGAWIGSYCRLAEPEAMTDFFRGILLFIDAFIDTEIKLIPELKRIKENGGYS